MGNYKTIKYECDGGIAIVSLNRPRKLNAINFEMILELKELTNRISQNDTIKCLIIRGEGKAFCSGADLTSGEKKWKDTEGRMRLLTFLKIDPRNVVSIIYRFKHNIF